MRSRKAENERAGEKNHLQTLLVPVRVHFLFLITSQRGLCPRNHIVHRETGLYIRDQDARDESARPRSCKRALRAKQVFVVSCTFMGGIVSSG